ncbi:uncharacterized protein E0L32_004339 [Thyridium curvatum]|uniref:Co-chaperone HscB C-terminal oligomerisation domain-containing protein n=1 Tax=Thyridium curvatum TaxID=1093900 RepID=A0A507BFA2_9PEZI|nr:uncharacterized protein E0L32_004339 [Thyridium curvatum]TPX15641.1 hypothetical protein E0L32_004339 [Thyridium curvatum]
MSRYTHGLCASCARQARRALLTSDASLSMRSFSSTCRKARLQPASQLPRRTVAAAALPAFASQTRSLTQSAHRRLPASTSAPAADTSASTTSSAQASKLSQKPPSYYDLFPQTLPQGPPPAGPFHIDERALRREFLRLQAAAHPDLQQGSSSSSGETTSTREAGAASAHINEAFRTLKSPLLRAQYLLRERFGVDLAGDEAGAVAGRHADPELLGAVMEARETIEEARAEEELEPLRRENEERIRLGEEALGRAFRDGDAEAAAREAVRMRYWVNIREGIDAWEEGREPVLQH